MTVTEQGCAELAERSSADLEEVIERLTAYSRSPVEPPTDYDGLRVGPLMLRNACAEAADIIARLAHQNLAEKARALVAERQAATILSRLTVEELAGVIGHTIWPNAGKSVRDRLALKAAKAATRHITAETEVKA